MSDAGAAQLRDLVTPSHGCGCGGKCGGGKECTCGAAKPPPALVYALGTIGFDFASEARDSFVQGVLTDPRAAEQRLDFTHELVDFLSATPHEAESLIWTLNLDATPIYAIFPSGPFAAVAYERLREALQEQKRGTVQLVSVPGYTGGSVRLLSGQTVPALVPAVRGMHSWSTQALVDSALGPIPEKKGEQEEYRRRASGLGDFLSRIYYDLRNLGITPEDRALNYAATNAFQAAEVIATATAEGRDLDRIAVHKSPVCRPDSDCYDVELSFFNPDNTNVAARVFRFTIDVSDVIPVSIGATRSFTRRL